MIFVAGDHIESIDQLSVDFQQVLRLIKNGQEWLEWALEEPTLSVFYAQSEQDLLVKIQVGLHETKLLKCDYFSLDLDKAIDFEDEDRLPLVNVFHNGSRNKRVADALRKKYKLVSEQELEEVPDLLHSFEKTISPLFHNMLFRERLELYDFIKQHLPPGVPKTPKKGGKTTTTAVAASPDSVNQEAFDFAKDHASTPSQFVHFARFYQGCAQHQFPGGIDEQHRRRDIEEIYLRLRDLSFKLIYVPNIGSFSSMHELSAELKDFILSNKYTGYRHGPAAMENIVQNVKVRDVSTARVKRGIELYIGMIRNSISNGYFHAEPVPQDGWLRTFTCLADNMRVIIQVDPTGDVFLSPNSGLTRKNRLLEID